MKTFDEALEYICDHDHDDGTDSRMSRGLSHMSNPMYAHILRELSKSVWLNISGPDPRESDKLAHICGNLMRAIELGVEIGREMYGEPATAETETIQ